jgi:hypothetical protein
MQGSSTKPPHYEEEPEDKNDEQDVPHPSTSLTLGHVVHAPKRASEDTRRFGESVIL